MIIVKNDLSFDLATATHSNRFSWKNKEVLWSYLVEKLSVTQHTFESVAEYANMPRDKQGEIKNVGGFVGGFLTGGKRGRNTVLHRQLITLDLDFPSDTFWDDFTKLYSCSAVLYSTHKHVKGNARFRLIMLMNREADPAEYEASARRIAGNLDIEIFDTTTFQPSRMMYWPSTSKDGEYVFKFQDGEPINVDSLLSEYTDWKDSSSWPVSVRVNKIITNSISKQGDPLEKEGVIGAFCRTYSIQEAIEVYLTDVYEPCDISGRYTYKEGSTSGGLVVYEDKFTYSHHSTDPTGEKLCNAFDLVRIHKFGLRDQDAKEGTPVVKMPSYAAMLDLATKDEKVRKRIVSEKVQGAKEDFADLAIEGQEIENNDWTGELDVDRKGNIFASIRNISIILKNDPKLKGCFATDVFSRRKIVLKDTPWRKITNNNKALRDQDEQNLIKYLEETYGILNRSNTKDSFDIHIDSVEIHPIKEYLSSLVWDGKKRLDTLFVDYLGAANTPYIHAITRKSLVAAIARVFQPGIKFDYVLTLVGEEGILKSTIIAKLGGEWFSDSFNFNMLRSKEAYEQIQAVWLVEIGELAGLRKADVEAAKQFISKQEDSFRAAYGRNVVTHKRQCVFFGTTNNRDFLNSPTGNRRFWALDTLVQTPSKDLKTEFNQNEINQVWAEALLAYKAKETLYLDVNLEKVAKEVQKKHTEIDDRTGIVEQYLDTMVPDNWVKMGLNDRREFLAGSEFLGEGTLTRNRVCAAEIWCECFRGMPKDLNRQNTKSIHNLMRNLSGWKENDTRLKFKDYGLQTSYLRLKNAELFIKEKVTSNSKIELET